MPRSREDPADPGFVRAHVRALGVKPSRLRGQHFLIAPRVADRLVAAAALSPRSKVLEIGAGLGAITERLAEAAKAVHAVELERPLARALARRFADRKNVTVIEGDALEVPRSAFASNGPYEIVASLPYSITSRVLRVFLEEAPQPESITVLIQREVAERAAALPGRLSQLGLLCQLYGTPEIVGAEIPPKAFFPEPEVTSSILRITGIGAAARARAAWGVPERAVWKLIRAGFQNRRKMLKNTLANLPGIAAARVELVLRELGYSEKARAQDLAPFSWVKMAKMLFDESGE
jgi:16S rRNA (adenine1518-N6/adenine1519-N6)-dimethyltransferase